MLNSFVSAAQALAALCLLVGNVVDARSVFAHYMVNSVTEGSGHAELDVDQAQAMGIEAFALNVGSPNADWAQSTIQQLFNKADQTGFKLFFSLDFYQTGDINEYTNLVHQYIERPSYLRAGSDNHPVISTFSVGNIGPDGFQSWKQDNFGNQIYFLPNADTSAGYDDPESWFNQWGDVVDGVFAWETAWPNAGDTPMPLSDATDIAVQNVARGRGKSYMAPLSSLQFKKCCGANWFRIGEANLPERMVQLLSLDPEFVEILTWNDAGESHYIGNTWPEGLNEEILAYGDSNYWPHDAWQPMITSWIKVYKAGQDVSAMTTPNGEDAIGSMWYRPILKTATCQKPENWDSATDAVNYGIIVGSDPSGMSIRVTSGGEVIGETPATQGLNYASVAGARAGIQIVELLRDGNPILTAQGQWQIVETNNDCHFNFQVVGLK